MGLRMFGTTAVSAWAKEEVLAVWLGGESYVTVGQRMRYLYGNQYRRYFSLILILRVGSTPEIFRLNFVIFHDQFPNPYLLPCAF